MDIDVVFDHQAYKLILWATDTLGGLRSHIVSASEPLQMTTLYELAFVNFSCMFLFVNKLGVFFNDLHDMCLLATLYTRQSLPGSVHTR